jgi:hypothetical protein
MSRRMEILLLLPRAPSRSSAIEQQPWHNCHGTAMGANAALTSKTLERPD